MPKKVKIKTTKNASSVAGYIAAVESDALRKDAKRLLKLFKDTTAVKPKMWGDSIIGFGEYKYYRSNGDEGEMLATGFSIRKSGPTLYVLPSHKDNAKTLAKLGPHKVGKSCLYLKNLEGIDLKVLETLIKEGLKDLKKNHEVTM